MTEDEQQRRMNLMRYGKCRVCGEPREATREEKVENGLRFVTYGLTCPNGHGGDE